MRKPNSRIKKYIFHGLATMCISILLAPTTAVALDTDLDGLTDAEESTGITLSAPLVADYMLSNPPVHTIHFPACDPGVVQGTPERAACLDPATPDLFVVLIRATDVGAMHTNLPAPPFDLLSKDLAGGGLGITIHEVADGGQALNLDKRIVVQRPDNSFQKALGLTENLNTTDGTELGVAVYGSLDSGGLESSGTFSTIYTERIKNLVNDTYGDGQDHTELIQDYIWHTLAHEAGHVLGLAVNYNKRFGGYHYKAGTGWVMDQFVKYTVKGSKVTFYISENYSPESQTGTGF